MMSAPDPARSDDALDGKKKKKGGITLKSKIRNFFRKDGKKSMKTDEDNDNRVGRSISAESVFLEQKKEENDKKKAFMKSMDAILTKESGRPHSFISEQNLNSYPDDDNDEEIEEDNTDQFFQSSWSVNQASMPMTTTSSFDVDLDVIPTTSHVNLKSQRDKLGIKQRGKRQSTTHGQRRRTASPRGIAQSLQVLPQIRDEPIVKKPAELRLYDPKASKRLSLGKEVVVTSDPEQSTSKQTPEVEKQVEPIVATESEPKEQVEKRRSLSPEKRSISPEKEAFQRSASPAKEAVVEEVQLRDQSEKSIFGDKVKRRSAVEEKPKEEEAADETEFSKMLSKFKKTAEQKKIETGRKAAEIESQSTLRKEKVKKNEENRSSVILPQERTAEKSMTPKRSHSMAINSKSSPKVEEFRRNSPKVTDRERSRTIDVPSPSLNAKKDSAAKVEKEEKGAEKPKKTVNIKEEKVEEKTPEKKIIINAVKTIDRSRKDKEKKENVENAVKKSEETPTKKAEDAPKTKVDKTPIKKVEETPKKQDDLDKEKTEPKKVEIQKQEPKVQKEDKKVIEIAKKEVVIEKTAAKENEEITMKKDPPQTSFRKNVQIRDSNERARSVGPLKVKTQDTDCSWQTLARKKTKNWNTENDTPEKEVSVNKDKAVNKPAPITEDASNKRKSVLDMVKNMEQFKVS